MAPFSGSVLIFLSLLVESARSSYIILSNYFRRTRWITAAANSCRSIKLGWPLPTPLCCFINVMHEECLQIFAPSVHVDS